MKSYTRIALSLAAAASIGSGTIALADDAALGKKIVEYFRWKQKLPADVTAEVKEIKPSSVKGMKSATLSLARGEQKQDLEVLVTDDGKSAIFNATKGDLKDSSIKGAKEATLNMGRPVTIIVPEGGSQVIVGAMEDISVDVSAKLKEEKEAEAKKAEENKKKLAADGQPIRGNKKAPVTIVEFSDFQCPFCAKGHDNLSEAIKSYGDKVRVVYKNFPLNFHPWAEPAGIAGECLFQQNEAAFWNMYDYLFKHQKEVTVDNVKAKALEGVGDAKIDKAKFDDCYDNKKTKDLVAKDMEDGQAVGVTGTPAFFINGKMLSGAQPPEAFKSAIDEALAKK